MTHDNFNDLWNTILNEIALTVSNANFNTWFKNTAILDKNNKTITIGTNSNFTKEWLQQKYHNFIVQAVNHVCPDISEIKYVVTSTNQIQNANNIQTIKTTNLSSNKHTKLNQVNIATENLLQSSPDPKTNLNPKYQFENFIVGAYNELAHAAACAVIENLGTKYNPLFIYGGVGLGKTHLIHATGNAITKHYKNKKIYYTSSEALTNKIIKAIRNGTITDIKEEYKQIDCLLIDDIQFIANKDKTQEEIFHIFNALYEHNKQIIFTSDRPPKSIIGIEERLRSRFEGGMIADISAPDYETRMAILISKTKAKNIVLPNNILEYIAQNITTNIRELEGSLNTILIRYQIKNQIPDLDEVKQLLLDYIQKPTKILSPNIIIKEVATFYNIAEDDLKSGSRRQDIIKARQVAMYLLRNIMKCSYPTIGSYFKNKDHTTVMHSYDKITQSIKNNPGLAQEIYTLTERIMNSNV